MCPQAAVDREDRAKNIRDGGRGAGVGLGGPSVGSGNSGPAFGGAPAQGGGNVVLDAEVVFSQARNGRLKRLEESLNMGCVNNLSSS